MELIDLDLSLIIVNYNTTKHLINCLDSFFQIKHEYSNEVIVVDNNSLEREIEKLQYIYPNVKFLFRNINDGFGAGCNYGAKYSRGRFLLFVNPDVTFLYNINDKLIKYLENNSDIALISPAYLGDGNNIIYSDCKFPGYSTEVLEVIPNKLIYLKFRIFDKKHFKPKTLPFEVNWVMGSYMLIKADVFNSLSGFDENFFLYYEDIDLQYRIKKLGYKVFYYPNYLIKHVRHSSVRTYHGENLYYYHMARSKIIYMYKHFNFLKRNLLRILHILGLLLRTLFLPFQMKYSNKRRQKLYQNITRIKLFFNNKRNIYLSKHFRLIDVELNKHQITTKDVFWQS